jgi:hypothetical protein
MANDLSALLLIYTSTGDRDGLMALSKLASASSSPLSLRETDRLTTFISQPQVD